MSGRAEKEVEEAFADTYGMRRRELFMTWN